MANTVKINFDLNNDKTLDLDTSGESSAITGVDSAGLSKYYGTDVSGTPGFFDLPGGGASTNSSLSKIPRNDRLVSYWSMDESANTTRADFLGNFNLSDVNGVGSVTGKNNNAADFNGTNDYLQNTTFEKTLGGSDFTISFWVNINSLASDNGILGQFLNDSGDRRFYVSVLVDGSIRFLVGNSTGTSSFTITTAASQVSVATTTLITVTFETTTGTSTIYKNGGLLLKQESSTTAVNGPSTANTVTTPFIVGRNGELTDYLDGWIDELAIWNVALTPNEITEYYNSGTGYFLEDLAETVAASFTDTNPGSLLEKLAASEGIEPRLINEGSFERVELGHSKELDYGVSLPYSSRLLYYFPLDEASGTRFSNDKGVALTEVGGGKVLTTFEWESTFAKIDTTEATSLENNLNQIKFNGKSFTINVFHSLFLNPTGVAKQWGGVGNQLWEIKINATGNVVFEFSNDGGTTVDSLTTSLNHATNSAIDMITVTYDAISGDANIYIDGVNDGNATFNTGGFIDSAEMFVLGKDSSGNIQSASMGHLCIWDVVLDAETIQRYYNYVVNFVNLEVYPYPRPNIQHLSYNLKDNYGSLERKLVAGYKQSLSYQGSGNRDDTTVVKIEPYLLKESTFPNPSFLQHYFKLGELRGRRFDIYGTGCLEEEGVVTAKAHKVDNGAVFDGSSYLYLENVSKQIYTDSVSVGFWVSFDSASIGTEVNLFTNETANSSELGIDIYKDATNILRAKISNTGGSYSVEEFSTTTFAADTLYHVVVTHRRSSPRLRIYVNGSLENSDFDSGTVTIHNTGAPFFVGAKPGAANYFQGTLSELFITGREMSSTEITTVYNSGAGITFDLPKIKVSNDVTEETLTGTVTLDNLSDSRQVLDPNGVARDVILPDPPVKGIDILVLNNSDNLSANGNTINIKETAAGPVAETLDDTTGNTHRHCLYTGTQWVYYS